MPIFGNSQIDDPSSAGVTGRTCSLWIGVYLSGCLRDRVPLWGKGTSDRFPSGIPGDWGKGLTHSSVGSSSGSAMGPSGSAGVDCGRLETSAGHISGSVSMSGLSVKSPDNSWSGPEGDSNGASNTAGDTSVWAGLVVKDSSPLAPLSCWGYQYGALQSRLLGLDQASGVKYPPGRASGVQCPLYSTPGLEGLAEKSVFPGLDIAPGSQSLSSYTAALQNQGLGVCLEVTLNLISHRSHLG